MAPIEEQVLAKHFNLPYTTQVSQLLCETDLIIGILLIKIKNFLIRRQTLAHIAYKSKDSKPDVSTSQVKALTC